MLFYSFCIFHVIFSNFVFSGGGGGGGKCPAPLAPTFIILVGSIPIFFFFNLKK